jgi:eukaryotic-like serine/threonine-protein kinase
LLGTTLEKRYALRAVLGEGGSARIYDALDVKIGRPVAVKILQPLQRTQQESIQRLLREARIASTILHSSICAVTDVGRLTDGSPFLVMDRMHGSSLSEHIHNNGALSPAVMVDLVAQVASALTVAHSLGIVHRDIKPANVMLTRVPGRPPLAKLLDFGSALVRGDIAGEHSKLTHTGMVIGTPLYMAPEQVTGERDIDGRTDVYGCGVLLYEGISGRRPFAARHYDLVLLEIAKSAPPPMLSVCPDVDPAIADIVGRAMARDRAQRYPTAAALLTDLSQVPPQRQERVAGRPQNWDAPTTKTVTPSADPWDDATRPR